jgi:dGTPase
MNWEQLLSLRRQAHKQSDYALNKTTPDWVLKWIMIVLFSLPLEVYKIKHRLFHYQNRFCAHHFDSLEVSVVGRSLGRLVGKKIIEKYPYLKEVHGFHMNDLVLSLLASLAHDIGNPPLDIQVKSDREYFSIE